MARPPYEAGDHVRLDTPEGPVDAVVSIVVQTPSVDPRRRWRVLCRHPDGTSIAGPFYCGEDGLGHALRPTAPDREPDPAV